MAEVIKRNGEAGPEEGKAHVNVVAQFEETKVDENGNLIASGRELENLHEGRKAHANVAKQFDGTIEDENGNLRAVPKPDVKAI